MSNPSIRRFYGSVAVVTVLALAVIPIAADAAARPASTVVHQLQPPASDPDRHSRGRIERGVLSAQAWGFAPGERVRVRELSRPGWQQLVRADRRGRLSVRLGVVRASKDVLTFVGLGAVAPAETPGTVTVSVPRIAVLHLG